MFGDSGSFTPCRIGDVRQNISDYCLVKFYAKFKGMKSFDPPLMIFDDDESSILVDYSFIESSSCQRGEWYRLVGTLSSEEELILELSLSPLLILDFDGDVYSDTLEIREEFLRSFDSLVAYACKHK